MRDTAVRAAATIRGALNTRLEYRYPEEDREMQELIGEIASEHRISCGLTVTDMLEIEAMLFNAIRRYDFLCPFLEDESISEIMVNGTEGVFVERRGVIERAETPEYDGELLYRLIGQMTSAHNRRVNESEPIADTRLPTGERVNIVLPPVALEGPIITIRKFAARPITMEDLIRTGSLPAEWAEYLIERVRERTNIFVSGGTGSGKTTFLNVLSDAIPKTERVITIEDSAELQLHQVPNLVRLEARGENLEGKHEISIRDLIRTSLRMRPDRIVVGEVRGSETVDMISALNTGHAGFSTGHANNAEDMLLRLENMFLQGLELPVLAVRQQIASAIRIIVHLVRGADGRRYVKEIVEVEGLEEGYYRLCRRYCAD